MKVCEIFLSIQGESTYAGLPCVFIRMSGCNLRCVYCDTSYAYEEGREMTEVEIVDAVLHFGVGLAEITGGEPLQQRGVFSLMKKLLDRGLKVLVETNGSVGVGELDSRAIIIMDIKTPGSGMSDAFNMENLKLLKPQDEIKFVIADRGDYEWSRDFIRQHNLKGLCTLLMSPVFGSLAPADLAGWMLEDRLDARFNLQIHKYIYHPKERGV